MRQVTKKLMAPVYASWETNGERILHWMKLISITGSTQILIQAIGLIVGIMTVRLLPVKEYAWFTIANTMLGALTVLSDSGISSGVMAEAGKDWQNKELMGKVLSTGLYMRHRFALYSMIVTLPVLAYMLINNGAEWWQTALIILALIPAFYASLSDTILEIPLKLHQDIRALQRNQLSVAIIRFFATIVSLFFFPFTFMALFGNGLPRIWANLKLRLITNKYAAGQEHGSVEIKKRIQSVIKKAFPSTLYFVFSGQISIWILSFLKKSTELAQIGALGKITLIFGFFSTVLSILIIPYFARLPLKFNLLIKSFLKIQFFSIFIFFIIMVLFFLFGNIVLNILGDNYAQMKIELTLLSLVSILNILSGLSIGMANAKGWFWNPVLSIPIMLLILVVSYSFLNLSTLNGIIFASLIQGFLGYSLNLFFVLKKLFLLKAVDRNILQSEF